MQYLALLSLVGLSCLGGETLESKLRQQALQSINPDNASTTSSEHNASDPVAPFEEIRRIESDKVIRREDYYEGSHLETVLRLFKALINEK